MVELRPRLRGKAVAVSYRNRLHTIQDRGERRMGNELDSRKREPSLDHPYMVATAYLKTTSRD